MFVFKRKETYIAYALFPSDYSFVNFLNLQLFIRFQLKFFPSFRFFRIYSLEKLKPSVAIKL